MSNKRIIGDWKECKKVEWKVPSFLTLSFSDTDVYESPSFTFENTSWNLLIYPTTSPEMLFLCLHSETGSSHDAICSLTIKETDGTLFGTATLHEITALTIFACNIVHRREIPLQLSSRGSMVITLSLKSGEKTTPAVLGKISTIFVFCGPESERKVCSSKKSAGWNQNFRSMRRMDLPALSKDFENVLDNKASCDTTLYVKEKMFRAHRAILIARSSVFAAMFKNNTPEKQTGTVSISDCDPGSFEQLLEYLYTGHVNEISFSNAFHLYSTSDKYDVHTLKTFCIDYLMQCLTIENSREIISFAYMKDEAKLLLAAQKNFNHHREILTKKIMKRCQTGRTTSDLNEWIEFEWEAPSLLTLSFSDTDVYESPSFIFANTSWNLRIYPATSPEMLLMYLDNDTGSSCDVICSLTIKWTDGTLFGTGISEGITAGSNFVCYTRTSQKLSPTESMVIALSLKYVEEEKSPIPGMLPVDYKCSTSQKIHCSSERNMRRLDLHTLSKDLKNLLENKRSCDTTLYVKENLKEKRRIFQAHRVVLIARSPVFAAMFTHDTLEKQTGTVHISDCDPRSFELFLEYLYTGRVNEISLSSVFHLYFTADKYVVQTLKTFCADYLMQCLTVENFCDINSFADINNERKLLFAAQDFFNFHTKVLSTPEFEFIGQQKPFDTDKK